jgi:dihydroorotase
MAGPLLIKNGRVIDPANQLDETCDILIADGKVAEVGHLNGAVEKTVERVIDATGRLVTPGLIDIHVHFRDPGDEEEETIASGSTAAVAAGFTSVVCMPNTNPAIESETDVEYVHRKGRQTRKTHVYVMGAITKKREGVELAEMGMMAEAGARGFTDDGNGVQNSAVMLRAMKYAKMFDVSPSIARTTASPATA